LRSFLGTVLVLAVVGVALAGASYYVLRDHPPYGVLAAALALVEALALGVVHGGQRAFLGTLTRGLRSLQLGRTAVRLLFERLLGLAAGQEVGEHGGRMARTLERLPLAQAEKRLNQVVTGLANAPATGGGLTGWFRRWLQKKLLGRVQRYTLARFRQEGTEHEGVDLLKLQTELEEQIDERLSMSLKASLTWWTLVVAVGLPGLVLAETYGRHFRRVPFLCCGTLSRLPFSCENSSWVEGPCLNQRSKIT
jgi:hypothetical protein